MPSGADLSGLKGTDPAVITDKLFKYLGQQFSAFRLGETVRAASPVVVLEIAGVRTPLVFIAPGTYEIADGGKQRQKSAFGRGTVYVRHGAKSEPATSDDLRMVIDAEVERLRSSWLHNISKVINAPAGSAVTVSVSSPEAVIDSAAAPLATSVRLTADSSAPALKSPEFDKLYPYRQKELVIRLVQALPGVKITAHDVLCVRRAHPMLDDDPNYSWKQKWSSRQYSEAAVEWIVANFCADPNLFQSARDALKQSVALRSQ